MEQLRREEERRHSEREQVHTLDITLKYRLPEVRQYGAGELCDIMTARVQNVLFSLKNVCSRRDLNVIGFAMCPVCFSSWFPSLCLGSCISFDFIVFSPVVDIFFCFFSFVPSLNSLLFRCLFIFVPLSALLLSSHAFLVFWKDLFKAVFLLSVSLTYFLL